MVRQPSFPIIGRCVGPKCAFSRGCLRINRFADCSWGNRPKAGDPYEVEETACTALQARSVIPWAIKRHVLEQAAGRRTSLKGMKGIWRGGRRAGANVNPEGGEVVSAGHIASISGCPHCRDVVGARKLLGFAEGSVQGSPTCGSGSSDAGRGAEGEAG